MAAGTRATPKIRRVITALDELTRLSVSTSSIDDVLRVFAEKLATLVWFDSLGVSLVDTERCQFETIDLLTRDMSPTPPGDVRLPLAGTLLAQVIATGDVHREDDVATAAIPEASRQQLLEHGSRSMIMVPLVARGGAIGAVTLAAVRPAGFDDADVEVAAQLARPLASAIDQRRLVEETRHRAEELEALSATSQLITAHLDVASVLDRINRSVTELIGSTGCAIGLLDTSGTSLTHAAAHGYRTDEWRALAVPVGDGIIGACAQSGAAVRVDDIRTDPRSARRDIDEREDIRSMLCVPLRVGGAIIGVISAFSTRPAAFTTHHQGVLHAFAEQAGIAIANARLYEETERRARETRALFEAGRAVTASLDPRETMRVIMEQARNVLGAASCGIMTLDAAAGELVSVASLDLPPTQISAIRIKEGEGITGLAVRAHRPVQSADLLNDPRHRYSELQRETGLRSMIAAPLLLGDLAIGALVVLRRDVHEFSRAEEELLVAFADQAAIALQHARLYENLESVVAARTHELDAEKRFVEVALESLPLGVFVLDAELRVVRANPEAARVLAGAATPGVAFAALLGERGDPVETFIRDACTRQRVDRTEEELVIDSEVRTVRLTAAPLPPAALTAGHAVVLVEDITIAKRLERQMLLTERLTTAGRLASGVAHELNNPLATIAGCAEALLGRLREGEETRSADAADFAHYLGLIEEEAYRCKEITSSLLQFVREPGSRRSPTDLNALVQKAAELVSHQSRFAESRVVTELDPELPMTTVNEGQLRQVFLGLAGNALEAMDGRGMLTIRTRAPRDEIQIEFADTGPGIPDSVLPRIFDPFFTTKPPGQGTGLGLAIAQGIVADHGGRIDVRSRVGEGSVFRVALPRTPGDP
ncbi:MAG: hypothetical protein DMD81_07435 [Candidatus Rokuibacteriota bacterium]|nr:MAG: hypothetical protein DMD81_07435 [Candidatus Rokubacteria bacterium]